MRRKSKKRKPRTADQVSATPEARAARMAIHLAGGAIAVGKMLDPPRSEVAVHKWFENPHRMDPKDARAISKAGGYQVPVALMLPKVFAGLTCQELGYIPAAYPEQPKS